MHTARRATLSPQQFEMAEFELKRTTTYDHRLIVSSEDGVDKPPIAVEQRHDRRDVNYHGVRTVVAEVIEQIFTCCQTYGQLPLVK